MNPFPRWVTGIGTIFTIALMLRLSMVGVWHHTGQGERIPSDAYGYYEIADNLVQGKGFRLQGELTARRGPIYPYFIMLLDRAVPMPLGLELIQAILGALSSVVLFFIGRISWGRSAGLLASGIYAIDYFSIRQVVSPMPEILFVFFVLTSTWLICLGQKENRILPVALAGIFSGLALLTKEVLAFYFLALGFWPLFNRVLGSRRVMCALMFFLGLGVSTMPWLVRNRLVFGQWGFVTSNIGHAFYLGNNPLISGRIGGAEWEYSDDSGFPQQDPALPPLLTQEADRYLFQRGLEFVQDHPVRFLELTGRKFLRFWFPYFDQSPLLAKLLSLVTYLPVLFFGVLGLWGSRQRAGELAPLWGPLVYLTMVYSITISGIRYRYPATPFLVLFASAALETFGVDFFKGRKGRMSGLPELAATLPEGKIETEKGDTT